MPKNKWMYGLVATLISFLLFELANFSSYSAYNTSMGKVQTVDFNMLSHMLPTKLSYLLINRDFDEIKKTLESNYGVFGFVLTDCTLAQGNCAHERVIFAHGKNSKRFFENQLWRENFDLLRSQPPIQAEQSIPDIKFRVYKKLSHKNVGNVIGRIYYISSSPESFIKSQISWIDESVFGSRNDRYSYKKNVLIFVFSLFLFTFFFFIRKHRESSIATQTRLEHEVLKQKDEKQIEEIKRLQAENDLLNARDDLLAIENFNKTLSNQIDQNFSSVVANQLQHLDSIKRDIISRIKNEIRDIIHDVNKAPLLVVDQGSATPLQIKNSEQLSELVQELDDSIETIRLAITDLREMTSLAPEQVNLKDVAQNFINNLPPTLLGNNAPNIELNVNEDVLILANPYHIKSIIKNALYNSTAALKKKRRTLKDENYHAEAKIRIHKIAQQAIIEIIDNGSGVPEEYIDGLYESMEKVNTSQGELRGNGSLIVAAYLSLHNGSVEKRNLPAGGACITFYFPLIT